MVSPLSHVSSCHTEVTSQCNFLFNMLVLGFPLALRPSHWGPGSSLLEGTFLAPPREGLYHLAARSSHRDHRTPFLPAPRCMDLPKQSSRFTFQLVALEAWRGAGGGEERARGEVTGEGAEGAQASAPRV